MRLASTAHLCRLSVALAHLRLRRWLGVFKVRTLPSILLRMVVMCPLHLATFLEISGAVAFLHSLLMSAIVVSDKLADAILVFCCCAAIRCVFVTCVALQRLQVRLLGPVSYTHLTLPTTPYV